MPEISKLNRYDEPNIYLSEINTSKYMDLTEEIDQVANRAEDQVEHIQNEESTKHALVIPFIKALGYDPYDLQEVIPEFTADFAEQKGEKVDYALLQDGEPAILMECKTAGKELSVDQAE
jgi:hypothetical protein